MQQNTLDDKSTVNIGLRNYFVPSEIMSLPEPMLTQIGVAMWSH